VEGAGKAERGMEISENGKGRKRSKRKGKKEKGMGMNGEIRE
jgi:hypothetical protein